MSATEAVLVIGVGNRMRRDDGAGPAVLDRLAARAPANLETEELAGDCARLIELWDGRAHVIVVDATQSGAEAGTVIQFDALAAEIPRELFIHTSHAFGMAEAVATAGALGRLPGSLRVFGIEGAAFGFGEGLTAAVEASAEAVAGRIALMLEGG